MDIRHAVITVLSGMAGTLGFSILFRSNKSRMLCNTLGGALTCVVYVICCEIFEMEFFKAILALFLAFFQRLTFLMVPTM